MFESMGAVFFKPISLTLFLFHYILDFPGFFECLLYPKIRFDNFWRYNKHLKTVGEYTSQNMKYKQQGRRSWFEENHTKCFKRDFINFVSTNLFIQNFLGFIYDQPSYTRASIFYLCISKLNSITSYYNDLNFYVNQEVNYLIQYKRILK